MCKFVYFIILFIVTCLKYYITVELLSQNIDLCTCDKAYVAMPVHIVSVDHTSIVTITIINVHAEVFNLHDSSCR